MAELGKNRERRNVKIRYGGVTALRILVLYAAINCFPHVNAATLEGVGDVAFSMDENQEAEELGEDPESSPSSSSSGHHSRQVVFNWHKDKRWVPDPKLHRQKCTSLACKWRHLDPSSVHLHQHRKWHPIKKQLQGEDGKDGLPIGVALGILANMFLVAIPLLIVYLWTKKSSKMINSFRGFLHMKTLMVDSALDDNSNYRKVNRMTDPSSAEDIQNKRKSGSQGHLFAAICVVSILQGIEVAALAAFFPPAALKKGVSETMAGIIFAMRPCVQVVLSPIAGKYIKDAGNQGLILIGGMALLACVYVLFGLVESVLSGFAFTFVCFAAALIQGTVDAFVNTAAFNIILALYSDDVVYRIAMKEVYDTVGYLVGTPLGGILYDAGGFMFPFIILGIGILLSSAGLYVITPNGGSAQQQQQQPQPPSPSKQELDPVLNNPLKFYFSFLSRRTALILFLGTVLSGASYPFLETTLTIHAQHLELNTAFTGLLFSICNGFFLVTMAVIGHGDGVGLPLAAYGLMGSAMSFFFMGPTPVIPVLPLNTSMLTIAMVLCGVATALAWLPMMNMLLIHLQRSSGNGTAANAAIAGVASVATSMGIVLGSLLGGFLADAFGFSWATTIWALAFILFFVITQTENKKNYMFDQGHKQHHKEVTFPNLGE